MNTIGTRQKWLFKYRPEGMKNLVKLENTGSKKLDGKYTTRRMQQVVMNDEINFENHRPHIQIKYNRLID